MFSWDIQIYASWKGLCSLVQFGRCIKTVSLIYIFFNHGENRGFLYVQQPLEKHDMFIWLTVTARETIM